ncbi:GreA/GreB family elongation factor [Spongiibacter marinus]|uniref:GreA/GreB family elongation factor n=1 Tax=Spongiibacter marinus TaxID=354246 RepID=UPI0035679FE9
MSSRETTQTIKRNTADKRESLFPAQRLSGLLSDTPIFSQPAELLAILCRLEQASVGDNQVQLGDHVLLECGEFSELLCVKLVLPKDVTLRHYHLSVFSPLGRAVYQQPLGAELSIKVARRSVTFRLLHFYR